MCLAISQAHTPWRRPHRPLCHYILLPFSTSLFVSSPKGKMVQHDGSCHSDIERSCPTAVLRNVHKLVALFLLTFGQALNDVLPSAVRAGKYQLLSRREFTA